MADKGDVGLIPSPLNNFPIHRYFPVWLFTGITIDRIYLQDIPVNGYIYGVVAELGAVKQGITVQCFHQPTGNLCGSCRTNAAGEFTFIGLTPIPDYTVLVRLAGYNSKVFADITPALAYDWIQP